MHCQLRLKDDKILVRIDNHNKYICCVQMREFFADEIEALSIK